MLDEEARARRAATRTIAFVVIGFVLACIGVGCFTIGTVEVNKMQGDLQQRTDRKANTAAIKSAHAVTRTTAISHEQIIIRDQTIKNCQVLVDYVHNAIGTRQESEANAYRYAALDEQIADDFSRFDDPAHHDLAALFRYRIKLDHQRAHIARRSQNELTPALKETCTLPLPIGT